MTRLAVLTILAVVPSCWLPEEDDDGVEPDPPVQCTNGVCVTPDNPFRFAAVPRLGVGTEVPLTFVVHSSLHANFEIVSSDPSIEVVQKSDGRFVRAHGAGTFAVIARNTETQAELARVQVVTADVASIGFTLRVAPVATEPLASLAALAGGHDAIGVAFRDAQGFELAGSAPVAIDDPTIVGLQAPDWFELDGPPSRMRFGIIGLTTGTTRATITMFDGRTATLPIEVVDAVATLDIVTVKFVPDGSVVSTTGVAAVNDLVFASLVGKTSDGRFVAGVYASWDATGPVQLYRATGYATTPDVQVQPTAPGTIEVIATTGGMTATATLVAH